MLALVPIFFGAGFTLATAYALGVVLLRKTPAPPEIALGLGAVAESFLVFLCLLLNIAHWTVFLGIGLAALAALTRFRRFPLAEPPNATLGHSRFAKARLAASVIFGAYGLWYFVNALAPETTADGITYHLGLPYEYVRLGGFPDHITFYDLVPQGMEMLYTVAFAFGRHSAAKLVEFGLFLATPPLIFRLGRRMGAGDLACLVAGTFYFTAPVVGLTGSSSYNDAASVFFMLTAFYLLLVWRDTLKSRYLPLAGLLAGFCYAIKLPGIMVAAAAVLFVMAQRNRRAAAVLAVSACLVMAPWLLRNTVLTGNPAAPLMNSLFPNPAFHIATELELAKGLRSLVSMKDGVKVSVKPWQVPWELAFGDRLSGIFGPLLLLLPLGLLALAQPSGRLCWTAAVILVLPWFANTGARFLMPSVALAALALGMALPASAAWAAIVIQAVLCWPLVVGTWESRDYFRLHGFPLAAALRIESEDHYCRRSFNEYNVARLIEGRTPPDSRTLALLSVANAYLARDVTVAWQSAEGERLLDTLRQAAVHSGATVYDWKASWPAESLVALRFRLPVGYNRECDISEVQLYAGDYRLFTSPQWVVSAWPNRWEGPLALDGNIATRWRTWEPVRAGMFFEIDLDHAQKLTSAVLISHTPSFRVAMEWYGQTPNGKWRLLSNSPAVEPRPNQDLRLEATRAVRRAGYQYLLAPTGSGGNAPIGNVLVGHEPEWGLKRIGDAGQFYLFHMQ